MEGMGLKFTPVVRDVSWALQACFGTFWTHS